MTAASRSPGAGRKRTPTPLKLLMGNPGKRPLPKHEPLARVKTPPAPAFLSARAKREWTRTGRQLLEVGIVTELDRMALAGLIQSYMRWVEAQEGLAQTGLLIRGKDGLPRVNPLLKVSRDSQTEYTRLLLEFGLTPASRSRVSVEPVKEEDEFEALMRRRK